MQHTQHAGICCDSGGISPPTQPCAPGREALPAGQSKQTIPLDQWQSGDHKHGTIQRVCLSRGSLTLRRSLGPFPGSGKDTPRTAGLARDRGYHLKKHPAAQLMSVVRWAAN